MSNVWEGKGLLKLVQTLSGESPPRKTTSWPRHWIGDGGRAAFEAAAAAAASQVFSRASLIISCCCCCYCYCIIIAIILSVMNVIVLCIIQRWRPAAHYTIIGSRVFENSYFFIKIYSACRSAREN